MTAPTLSKTRGGKRRGQNRPMLGSAEVELILRMRAEKVPMKAIAKRLGVLAPNTLYRAINREKEKL